MRADSRHSGVIELEDGRLLEIEKHGSLVKELDP